MNRFMPEFHTRGAAELPFIVTAKKLQVVTESQQVKMFEIYS